MYYSVIEREDTSVLIPMETIQDHLRLYDQTEETILEQYRDAAITVAEKMMNRTIGQCKIHATQDKYQSRMLIPMGPVKEVESIRAFRNGEEIEVTGFRHNKISDEVVIPSEYSDCEDFHFIYSSGWNLFDVPKGVIQGLLQLIATFYEQREDQVFGVSVVEIPFSHKHLFKRWYIVPR
ncbi:hypothetical protein [Aeromonas hydrophila]|uniref:hypothetical protein n=1 Tax=Aeromonas hydrophila TaxID=644 RepID=UPI003EC581D0